MNNNLIIKEIIKKDCKIEIKYNYDGKWKNFLYDNIFFSEYLLNIENVPNYIAIIPFLVNILPIAWVFNLSIEIDEVDENFYNAISKIMEGYKNMYPTINFKSNITVKRLISIKKVCNNNSAVLFSGGVDAYCTLLRHIKEKVDLITIFGADIELTDKEGINQVNKLNTEIANELNVKYLTISSNFREIINYHNLYKELVNLNITGEWWHEFQHGIGLIGLVAPLSYMNNYKIVYIASSYSETQKGQYTCASDPTIDNYLKYSNTITIHDGYELNRQDKIKLICQMRNKLNINMIKLRVCWESAGGNNCCHCEKCYRTIMGLIAEKENPNNYNFNFTEENRKKMMKFLKKYLPYNIKNLNKTQYIPIKERMLSNYNIEDLPNDLKWFISIEIGNKNPSWYILKKRIKNKLKSFF